MKSSENVSAVAPERVNAVSRRGFLRRCIAGVGLVAISAPLPACVESDNRPPAPQPMKDLPNDVQPTLALPKEGDNIDWSGSSCQMADGSEGTLNSAGYCVK